MVRKRSQITGSITRCIIEGCKKRKAILFALLGIVAVCLLVWGMQNPKWKYRNAAEAYETENGVIIETADGGMREYEFLAPFANVKPDKMIACLQDDDGYYEEYYSIKGWDQNDYILCVRQVIMGDKYLMCAADVRSVPYELCSTIYGEAPKSIETAEGQYELFSKVMLTELDLGEETEKENCFTLKGYSEEEWFVEVQGEEGMLYRNTAVSEIPREFLYYLLQYGTGE